MLNCAVVWGLRHEAAGNPCKDTVRYRQPPRGRLLGLGDLAKLGAVLRRLEAESSVCVATVRLLLLTGCRQGEIRCLRWCEVKAVRLTLIDATTGPPHGLLGEAARELPNRLAESVSWECEFAGDRGDEPLTENAIYWFWTKARDSAGLVIDAGLHDLRHTHVSHAVMNGESLHVTGRLLGHRRASTTNRYIHLDDATLGRTAERIAVTILANLRQHREQPPILRVYQMGVFWGVA